MSNIKLLNYDDVKKQMSGRVHLLIGNGFSIGCDSIFSYPSIYNKAVENGLSTRAQTLFEKLGTNNFEGVMHLLDSTHWVGHHYGLVQENESELLNDNELIKTTLVEILCSSHPSTQNNVSDDKKEASQKFFESFHNIFCTNYDLLPYWANMYQDKKVFQDGFRADIDNPDADYLVFSERGGSQKSLFYIHGALHLFTSKPGRTLKLSYSRTNMSLMDLVSTGLSKQEYPLFVAEGSAEKKLEQIHKNSYLNYCYEKLGRVENTLAIFGHSLGDSDNHIRNIIAENKKLKTIYIGMYGNPDSNENKQLQEAVQKIKSRRKALKETKDKLLEINFFDSKTANVWGS